MEVETTALAGEQVDMPAIEQQTPVTAEVEENEQPIDLDHPEQEEQAEGEAELPEQEEQETPAEPELVDIELNGKAYKVPAELKANFMMQADYTRKTQEVAELKKTVEATKEQAAALFNSSQEYIEAKAYKQNLDTQLQQYQNVNWQQLEAEDPVGAMSHWRQFQTLKEQSGQVSQYLQNADAQRTAQAEQDIANRLQETRKFAQEKIPGWTPDVDIKVTEFAQGLGFQPEQLKAAMTPQIYQVLHLAMLGQQIVQKQQTAPKPSAPKPQPLRTVSAKASPAVTNDPEQMSMDEYAAYRKAQLKGRR